MPHYRKDLPPDARNCPLYPEYFVTPGVAGIEPPRVFRYLPMGGRYCELLSRFDSRDYGHYPSTMLRSGGKNRLVAVHTMVALTFLGPRPEGMEVCHVEDDPALLRDPSLYSKDGSIRLRYADHDANMRDADRNGTVPYYSPAVKEKARADWAAGKSVSAIALEVGAHHTTVLRWVHGRTPGYRAAQKAVRRRYRARCKPVRYTLDPLPE